MNYLVSKAQEFDKQYAELYLDAIQKADVLLNDFINRFPIDKLSDMELREYALGTENKDTFCWWLEYNTQSLGSIKGGSAHKHIIFYSKDKKQWIYPPDYVDETQAWVKLRSDILALINSYQDLTGQKIVKENLLFKPDMLKGKILYMYYPEKFLPIYNLDHLHTFLEQFGIEKDKLKGKDNIDCNLTLKERCSGTPPFDSWHPVKIKNFLYETFMQNDFYYKIAPGENAKYWDECRTGGYISIGWDQIGDITQYVDYDEFKSRFHELNFQGSKGKNTEKANEMWMFFNLKPGDKVLVNKGASQILATGTVTEQGYVYKDDLVHHKHVAYVKWDDIYEPPLAIPAQNYWPMKTVYKVPKHQFDRWRSIPVITDIPPVPAFTEEEELFFSRLQSALNAKGQAILFGPPGTGKTYLARRFIEWKNNNDNLQVNTKRVWMMIVSSKHGFEWEQILNSNGIQNFYIRSIKKNFMSAKNGDLVLCYRGKSADRGFIGLAEIEQAYDSSRDYITVRGIKLFDKEVHYDEISSTPEYKASQAGKIQNRGTMFEINEDFVQMLKPFLSDADKALLEPAGINNYQMCTFHPSYNYEDFIEGYKPVPAEDNTAVSFEIEKGIFFNFCSRAESNPDKPYYFIIDEINRGNIPKIFGEIITLLEKDKRGVNVLLPQSKEPFSMPENVYMIATMNTSDRSIKMMDAALKRRFVFIECMPNYDLIDKTLDNMNISPADILRKINRGLLSHQGRDKQIGHAYFMRNGMQITSLDELNQIYALEIIPLIQEYCYDDFEQLADIIGRGFIDTEEQNIKTEIFSGPDDDFISTLEEHFKG